ncbi:MAG: stretch-activated cation channel mid1, partial [Pleopsidium flavum]
MQFPKLTPLQSRFAASLAASLILVVLYLALSNPHFAYAADADSITHEDHNHPLLLELQGDGDGFEDFDLECKEEEGIYEPEFVGIDRGIVGRAPADITALGNNAPRPSNINAGDTQYWVFPNETLWGPLSPATPGLPSAVGLERRTLNDDEKRIRLDLESLNEEYNAELDVDLKRRQDGGRRKRTLYITLNTCRQPTANSTNPIGAPPQLQMYISHSERNRWPGPNVNDQSVPVQGGFANATLNATGAVYIGVAAPNNTDFSGIYNYELAASIDAPYHSYESETQNLFFIDSDTNSALLVTNDTTQANPNETLYQKWMTIPPPFSMFAHNENDSAIRGIEKSYCGMKLNAQIVANKDGQNTGRVEVGMTNRGLGRKPKEQFHIKSLNGSSTYYGFLAMDGNSTNAGGGVVGGGGQIWTAMNFSTKSDGNCQLLFDLSYCSEVAYAVPSNPTTFPNIADLKALYDDNARNLSRNFSYSLQQIPCNTTSSAQYSLAKNCNDCADAYKTWLCAVTIPRCHDFSSSLTYLQPRNVAQTFINGTTPSASSDPSFSSANQNTVYMNSSRNPLIDTNVKPGPYKEVLPCQDLCYTLVQSCPATLGFACPLQKRGLSWSYGVRDPKGDITCSYLGAAYFLNAAGRSGVSAMTFAIATVV